jgi:hypothetical protein
MSDDNNTDNYTTAPTAQATTKAHTRKIKTRKTKPAKPATKATSSHDKKIKLLVKENPHARGTALHKQFALYENGMTVTEALAAGSRIKAKSSARHRLAYQVRELKVVALVR